MRTRYDLTQDSITLADDGTYYPDIFTIPIQKFRYKHHPKEHYLTQIDIAREDILMYKEYGVSEFDDFVFWLNNIDYITDMEPGDKISIPSKEDMEKFYYTYRE